MILVSGNTRIWLAAGVTDMPRGAIHLHHKHQWCWQKTRVRTICLSPLCCGVTCCGSFGGSTKKRVFSRSDLRMAAPFDCNRWQRRDLGVWWSV
jgi:hypothetical protein